MEEIIIMEKILFILSIIMVTMFSVAYILYPEKKMKRIADIVIDVNLARYYDYEDSIVACLEDVEIENIEK